EATGRQCPCSDTQDNLPDRAKHERCPAGAEAQPDILFEGGLSSGEAQGGNRRLAVAKGLGPGVLQGASDRLKERATWQGEGL
ncbi:MAG TPA: hypothetical protein VFV39_09370, partial [Limnobacter sp.]|nr:hypothetical protein [Limnobacter sp.]